MRVWNLRTTAANILLGCLGILVSLFLIELALRLVPDQTLDSIIEVSSQRLVLYELDPQIGWTLRPNARTIITSPDDRDIPVKINPLGIRDQNHPYTKAANTFRVLILGDSFAEAQDVYLEESFPFRVEQCLNQKQPGQSIEVINGGVSGYSPVEEYLYYRNEGVKYNPDLVILVLYVGNDLVDLDSSMDERLVAAFGGYDIRLEQGQLRKRWVSWAEPGDEDVPRFEQMLRRYSRLYYVLAFPESKIYRAFKNVTTGVQATAQANAGNEPLPERLYIHVKDFARNPVTPPRLKEAWQVFQVLIQRLKAEVEANGSQLVVTIIPADYQVNRSSLERALQEYPSLSEEQGRVQWWLDEPNQTIMREMERRAIAALDLKTYFQAHDLAGGSPLYFEGIDEHLNRDGHKLMAEVMCDWLIRNESVRLPGR